MPGVAPNCDRFYKIKAGDTCDAIASANGITFAQLRAWNTGIDASCSNLWLDYSICTRVPGAAPTPGDGAPALPGSASNCNKWYKIVSGDTCDVVAAKNTITVDQLRSWNTQVGASKSSRPLDFHPAFLATDHSSRLGCNGLLKDYLACVGVPGAARAGGLRETAPPRVR